jgi:hypothetical protein
MGWERLRFPGVGELRMYMFVCVWIIWDRGKEANLGVIPDINFRTGSFAEIESPDHVHCIEVLWVREDQ